jgi:hypothetical protein
MEEEDMLYIYRDLAYQLTYGVMAPYSHPRSRRHLSQARKGFNQSLSSVRIAVENCFSKVQSLWTYTAFPKGLKIGKQPVSAIFAVAVLLTNCHSCLRGNTIATRFAVPPPSLEEYFLLN